MSYFHTYLIHVFIFSYVIALRYLYNVMDMFHIYLRRLSAQNNLIRLGKKWLDWIRSHNRIPNQRTMPTFQIVSPNPEFKSGLIIDHVIGWIFVMPQRLKEPRYCKFKPGQLPKNRKNQHDFNQDRRALKMLREDYTLPNSNSQHVPPTISTHPQQNKDWRRSSKHVITQAHPVPLNSLSAYSWHESIGNVISLI